ncbi:amphi-Trp domain-containing protein [Alteribacillus sp. JSM 102045]|uniref:amphi-Trp domain-containing protein n=1 Tax=Alteribacillus sp. JSM 102045 TaxID=1562101 RepID=UPI0035BF54F1
MFGQERLGEDIRFEKENRSTLEEAALHLEEIAASLRKQGKTTVENGKEQITLSPSKDVRVSLEYVKKGKHHKTGFYLEWKD